MILKTIKKYILIFVGTLSLILGIIGIFLPVLPTTPFLLLSSGCYIKSSEQLHNWLINHKVFGPYIYNYITYKAIHRKTKKRALILLWSSLLISMYIISKTYLTILLFVIGIGVSIHLYSLKDLEEEISIKNNKDII